MRTIAFRVFAFAAPALGCIVATAPGCGSRGPLDDGLVFVSADASLDATTDAPVTDAASDGAPDAPVDAGHDATPIDCIQCIFSQCQEEILNCVQSQPCQQAFQCVAQNCLAGGGGPDPSCILKCASASTQGAAQVFLVFQCVTMTCGPDCASILGALGGLGGGGGGGGGGRRDGG
jgi:hypothetical protein